MAGTISTSPGPFTRQKRPSRNTTPRSYSRNIRTDATTSTAIISSNRPNPIPIPIALSPLARVVERCHRKDEAVASRDAHGLAANERHRALHAPALAMDARPAFVREVVEQHAGAPDQLLAPSHD